MGLFLRQLANRNDNLNQYLLCNYCNKVKLKYTVIAISLLLFPLFHSSVSAAMSLDIKSGPEKINLDEEAEIEVAFSSSQKKTIYYLQTAFTVSGKTAYFGYTQKNDGSWHNYSESFDNFFQITTDEEGSWSGKLKGKPDVQDNDFKGSGDYLVKIGRFTSSGKSHDWSDNSWDIEIIAPPATLTPTKIPTVKPTVKPTNTPKPIMTKEAVQNKTVTSATVVTVPIKTISQLNPTDSIKMEEQKTTIAEDKTENVLGEVISEATDQSEKKAIENFGNGIPKFIIIFLIISGIILMIGAVFLSIRQINKQSGKSDFFS